MTRNTVNTTISIEPEHLAWIDRLIASGTFTKRSQVIRWMCGYFIERDIKPTVTYIVGNGDNEQAAD
jgi:metal-responsive CopG/Arc/MetJ family transcriptional regulator